VLDAPAAKTFPLISNLDAAVAAELVSIVDRKVRFHHPLVRSAVHQAAALRNVEQIRPNADTRQREDESGVLKHPASWFRARNRSPSVRKKPDEPEAVDEVTERTRTPIDGESSNCSGGSWVRGGVAQVNQFSHRWCCVLVGDVRGGVPGPLARSAGRRRAVARGCRSARRRS
jgi:hypothetical protein